MFQYSCYQCLQTGKSQRQFLINDRSAPRVFWQLFLSVPLHFLNYYQLIFEEIVCLASLASKDFLFHAPLVLPFPATHLPFHFSLKPQHLLPISSPFYCTLLQARRSRHFFSNPPLRLFARGSPAAFFHLSATMNSSLYL